MDRTYLAGLLCGITRGLLMQGGQLLQKKVVNDIRFDDPARGFFRRLIRSPLWVFGYVEELNRFEITGIILMIIGIFCLGLSELSVNSTQVRTTLADTSAQIRILIFTAVLFLCCLVSRSLSYRINNRRGLSIALGNGFLSCLSDFWINPLLAVIFFVLTGRGISNQTFFFIMASLILVFSGSVITWSSQVAFKYAQASNIIPVAQVPIQISPIVVYFFVFGLTPPHSISAVYILAGTLLTILAGFLLGRRPEIATIPE